MKKFNILLAYDSGKRYIFPIEVFQEVLGFTEKDLQKLETALLREIQKNG